jgi:SAM-dependent methyltransferase
MATPGGGFARDTDADWKQLAATEPYWAVVTHPEYKTSELGPEAIEAFYASGRREMAEFAGELATLLGAPLKVGSALDFGCGVGRLAEAMTLYADRVAGYDVAPAMLEIARARGKPIAYADALPEGPFDWINSYIVFQHIPPARGLVLLEQLLDRLAPGGVISLQFTVWRDEALRPAPWREKVRRVIDLIQPREGLMSMYDYDLGQILERLNRRDISRMTMTSTDHGGHHGVMIYGQRDAVAPPVH